MIKKIYDIGRTNVSKYENKDFHALDVNVHNVAKVKIRPVHQLESTKNYATSLDIDTGDGNWITITLYSDSKDKLKFNKR